MAIIMSGWAFNVQEEKGPTRKKKLGKITELVSTMLMTTKDLIEDLKPTERTGVALGTIYGAQDVNESYLETVRNIGFDCVSPSMFVYGTSNSGSGSIAIECGFDGPNITFLGSMSARSAIKYSIKQLKSGEATRMITGGYDIFKGDSHVALLALELDKNASTDFEECVDLAYSCLRDVLCDSAAQLPTRNLLDILTRRNTNV
jgi:3-oxoacyl-(acyl-carrier-protein) synthase